MDTEKLGLPLLGVPTVLVGGILFPGLPIAMMVNHYYFGQGSIGGPLMALFVGIVVFLSVEHYVKKAQSNPSQTG